MNTIIGHGLKPLDVEFMRKIHHKVNIIPVIGKSDCCTKSEITAFKEKVIFAIVVIIYFHIRGQVSIILYMITNSCHWKIRLLHKIGDHSFQRKGNYGHGPYLFP